MASVELELRWQIAEVKAEERTYEQFVEEQITDYMNDYLKEVKAKHTSIPIFSEAQGNGQSTLSVPSVKFQDSAIFSTISTTTSVTTPILVTAFGMHPTARPFDPRNLPITKEEIEEDDGTPSDTKLSHDG